MDKDLLNYFSGDELAASTWQNKYALKDNDGNFIEKSPIEMHKRLAKEFWRVEKEYIEKKNTFDKTSLSEYGQKREELSEEKIFELFDKFKYIVPAGSVMSGAGSGKPVSLSNCFVLPTMPEDSYSSIMSSRSEMVQLEKRRGGTGVDLSNLRPRGASVNNAAKTSTGAASFMEGYSAINNEVAQQGRRGALMVTISILHPDSPEFIEMKQDLTKVTGANVSVKIPDSFMEAVEKDEDFVLRWPIGTPIDASAIPELESAEYGKLYKAKFASYIIRSGESAKITPVYFKKIRAKELWDKLIHCAWNTAEPGILFESQLHNWAPDGVYPEFRAVSTNPCGEIPMEAGNSCRLIHCNLTSFIDNPYLENAAVNYDRAYKTFYEATRLGDDLVSLEIEAVNRILGIIKEADSEKYVWEKILNTAKRSRRAGVGFFGLSDLIASLGVKFCSPESIEITDHLCKVMMKAELDAEIDMAIERGCFPGYNKNIEVPGANDWYSFIEETYPEQWERMQKYGRRNVSFSTIAPTGSVAMVARASSGIEPVFMPFYTRRRKCNSDDEHYDFVDKLGIKFQEFVVVHPGLEDWAKTKYPDEDIKNWKLEQWEKAYEESPWKGSTSPEIDWEKRVELQGVVQKYITHAISSTVNLPNSVTEEEVSKIYLTAWKTGNKGQTVYRDGCRDGVLISVNEKKKDEKFRSYVEAPKRPKILEADFHTTRVKGEVFYVMVGLYLDKPYEVFVYKPELGEGEKPPKQHRGEIIKIKKGVYTFKSDTLTIENISKDLSPLEYTVVLFSSMLLRTGANLKYVLKTAQKAKDGINGFVSALVRILSKYSPEELLKGEICPECGNDLTREGGCIICKNCGYSVCL
jgi:ribonucleoside-diphosphate reductase alpha chain